MQNKINYFSLIQNLKYYLQRPVHNKNMLQFSKIANERIKLSLTL